VCASVHTRLLNCCNAIGGGFSTSRMPHAGIRPSAFMRALLFGAVNATGTTMPPVQITYVKSSPYSLPNKERQRFLEGCEQVELTVPDILCEPGKLFGRSTFPSTASFPCEHASTEARAGSGLIGNEGMCWRFAGAWHRCSRLQALVRGPGSAWRIDAAPFGATLAGNTGYGAC